jgi:hypothetical protein
VFSRQRYQQAGLLDRQQLDSFGDALVDVIDDNFLSAFGDFAPKLLHSIRRLIDSGLDNLWVELGADITHSLSRLWRQHANNPSTSIATRYTQLHTTISNNQASVHATMTNVHRDMATCINQNIATTYLGTLQRDMARCNEDFDSQFTNTRANLSSQASPPDPCPSYPLVGNTQVNLYVMIGEALRAANQAL